MTSGRNTIPRGDDLAARLQALLEHAAEQCRTSTEPKACDFGMKAVASEAAWRILHSRPESVAWNAAPCRSWVAHLSRGSQRTILQVEVSCLGPMELSSWEADA